MRGQIAFLNIFEYIYFIKKKILSYNPLNITNVFYEEIKEPNDIFKIEEGNQTKIRSEEKSNFEFDEEKCHKDENEKLITICGNTEEI